MAVRVRVDEKGRITLPKSLREVLNIMPGDELVLDVKGDKIVIEKSVNPFEKLGKLMGNISFNREMRVEAERELLKVVRRER